MYEYVFPVCASVSFPPSCVHMVIAAPVLFPTDMKEDVLTPAKYPSEIEALAVEVLQSYQDDRICLDPFVSPYMAPPEMWKGLPPINFVVSGGDFVQLKCL